MSVPIEDEPELLELPAAMALRATLLRYGISTERAAKRLRVAPRTFRRWLDGSSETPWCAMELLRRLAQAGDI